MGQLFSALSDLFSNFGGKKPARILLLGLDAAGKTTILYKVKLGERIQTIPTIGFNVETIEPCKGVTFTVWDVGGQDKIRALWRHYYENAEGLMFVVDSSDRERLREARDELDGILGYDEMRDVPVVVIGNKQDLPNAMTPSELIDGLRLRKLSNRWHVQGASALSGEGLFDGFHTMSSLVKESRKTGRS